MWIDLDTEDSQEIIHHDHDTDGKPTGKERIIIPTFDHYSRKFSGGRGKYRVTTFAYKIRCARKSAYMLKNLLCKILSEDNNLQLIPYGLNSVTIPTMMCQIIIKQNNFIRRHSDSPHKRYTTKERTSSN